MKKELRNNPTEFRVLTEDDGQKYISGYAAVYRSMSLDLGGFFETIEPGAFDRALKEQQDVMALAEHDPKMILGRSSNGTLVLTTDDTGLHMKIAVPDTSVGRDYLELVERGDVRGASFSFNVAEGGEAWAEATEKSPVTRTLTDVNLFDVGPVSTPAYPDTAVAVRSLQAWQESEEAGDVKAKEAARRERELDIADKETL